jgi:hypothetical protein
MIHSAGGILLLFTEDKKVFASIQTACNSDMVPAGALSLLLPSAPVAPHPPQGLVKL